MKKGLWDSTSIIPITLSFIFLFIYHFEEVLADPTRHLCRPDQRDALVNFKNEFEIGPPSFNLGNVSKTESWGKNNSECCKWEGVTCNAKSGEVIELDLSSSRLVGRFHSNSSLFRLQNLHFLDLSNNDLHGRIPSSIGNLSHLTSLNFYNNQFSSHLPSSIGNLHFLTTLDLSFNKFSGPLPSSFGNLSHITYLRLSLNKFSGRIPSSIGNLFHLTSLDLSLNHFSDQIPSSIGNLTQLHSLSLSLNQFFGQIPYSIGTLSHLTLLSVDMNNLDGEIPSSFGNLNQLTYLNVNSNKLSGNLPIELLNLTELSDLYISDNQFNGALPPNITSLSKLEYFFASNNAFTGTLPSSLFNIPSLTEILLNGNQLNGTLEFGNMSSPSNIDWLDISSNNFIGPIPRSISKLVNLATLYLSHLNTTTTIDLNDILSYFKRLTVLDLSGNHVSATNKSSVSVSDPPSKMLHTLYLLGCGITEFPELLRTQHGMVVLDISNNKIKGQVPGWLWTLPYLQYVNLSNNTFIGFESSSKKLGLSSIPDVTEYPYIQRHLLASNNNFMGEIPSFICSIHSLTILDLSHNNFNGSIPPCMGNLKQTLTVLNLRQNNLSGGLPEHIFKSLRSLDVGHNQLVGKLPRSLISFSTLEVLNVESNKINDTFPFWLSSLQKLQVLVLRSNAFHGPIDHASFPELRIIDISHNHFYGTLPPDYFVKWNAMSSHGTHEDGTNQRYMGSEYYYDSMVLMNKGVELELVRILTIYTALDISGNKFEGEIPQSIGLLQELHVLNLSNNAFTGHIPSSMGNLTALESLDVSQNKLSGEIPQELGNLSFLAYMNFSHNKLTSQVPGSTQFRTQPCSSFEDNLGLFSPSCIDVHTPSSQNNEMSESEEEVLSWTAALIGFGPGLAFGLTIGYTIFSNKPKWFMNPFGRKFCRQRSTTTQ